MILERFQALSEAYGGDIGRWPEAERGAARALAQASRQALALLADAQGLDHTLAAHALPAPGQALRAAILAGAPQPRRRYALPGWFSRAGLGAGLVAAASAGVIVGLTLASSPAAGEDPWTTLASPVEATAFGPVEVS